jgi:hypothetical protein
LRTYSNNQTFNEVIMTRAPGNCRGRGVVAALLAIAFVAAGGCTRQPPPVNVPPPPDPSATARAAWNDFAAAFIESYFKSHPFFAAQAGRHEFDGQMADWSATGLQTEIDRLKKLRTQAEGIAEEPLEPAQRFERDYLLSVIDSELFWLDQAKAPFKNPAWYINNLDPELYLSRNYAPLEKRLTGYIGMRARFRGLLNRSRRICRRRCRNLSLSGALQASVALPSSSATMCPRYSRRSRMSRPRRTCSMRIPRPPRRWRT